MFNLTKRLINVFSPRQTRQYFALQFLVLIMAFGEIIGIASIIPFMALVGDMSLIEQNKFISNVYKFTAISNESQFIFLVGICVLLTLLISALISMLTLWRLSMFANKVGADIADSLYFYYIKQNWLFHASGSSAEMIKKINNETTRLTNLVLMPMMQINARIVFIFILILFVFFYDPKVAIVGFSIFFIGYLFLFMLVRIRLEKNGIAISEVYENRLRLMNEAFGGIKDILLLGRDKSFIDKFHKTGKRLSYSQGTNTALAQTPRYLIELVAFGSMILLVLYLVASFDGDLGKIIPRLSVYAVAGIKLMPAFQQTYHYLALLKGNISAFESIEEDLSKALALKSDHINMSDDIIRPEDNIELENILFKYDGKKDSAINNLSIKIPVNSIIGLVGPSGSGKSTIVDIILGLIEPQKGNLKVDNVLIDNNNSRLWQNSIGFVPQSIFLSEGTISENIAFGIEKNEIDIDKVNNALKLSNLYEFVQNLDLGVDTKVGERGVQLSGGQRQRIGIARALYNDSDILIFDEATSSLDGLTEKTIMESIQNFSGEKTIIIVAHRLKTIQNCDQIFFIDNGEVIDKGSYAELIKKNEKFRNMATLA